MLLSPLAFAARSGGALITFALVMLDVSNKGKECASAHRLHRRVIVTISGSAHADLDAQFLQEPQIAIAGKLCPPIRMMQEPGWRMALHDSHAQGQFNELRVLGGSHRPTHHHAREQIQHHGQVEPALPGLDGLGVRHPFAIGLVCAELATQVIGSKARTRIALRRWLA